MTTGQRAVVGNADDPAFRDEFDEYLDEALKDPSFRRAFEASNEDAERRHLMAYPRPLKINGHEYRRRQRARARRTR